MTYADFKSWKISRCRNSLVKARKMRLAGNRKMAVWYLYLAQIGRQSLAA